MSRRAVALRQDEPALRAYPEALPGERLRPGRLRFFRTIAESVGVQGPTGGVVIGAALLAGISGGGTALVEVVAAVAMGFVAYAFVLFTRSFNSAGSVYGFTGAAVGPGFGFFSAFALLLVYVNFAGGVYASTADEAQPAFQAIGLHLPWQAYALAAFVLVSLLAYLDIRISSALVLILEGAAMAVVIVVSSIVLAKGGYHGHAFSSAPFRPNGAPLSVLGLGVVFSFSAFSGFEAAATLGEESARPKRVIPRAVWISLVVVAVYEIGVAFVVTNAYPSVRQLAGSAVPLVTVTDRFVSPWVGDLVNFAAVVSSFGAALACASGASRILFALGRDGFGPRLLARTSTRTGSPIGSLGLVAAVSFGFLVSFLWERAATRAVAVILTYGADLIIAAYVLVVAAALVYTIRRRMALAKTAILLVGLVVLGFVVKDTFVPFPAAPYSWDAIGAGATLLLGAVLPLVSPRLRRSLRTSPLLELGSSELLGTAASRDRGARLQ
ncbi:MAG: APC family permease [Acidimicrobiales bacterium]